MKITPLEIKQALKLRRITAHAAKSYLKPCHLHCTWEELHAGNKAAFVGLVRFLNRNGFKWP